MASQFPYVPFTCANKTIRRCLPPPFFWVDLWFILTLGVEHLQKGERGKNIVCSLQSRSPSLLWQKTCPKNVQEQWYQTLNLHIVIRLRSTPRFVAWKFLVSVCAGGASCKQPFDRNQKVYQLYHCQARQWRQSGSCFFLQMTESSSIKSGLSLGRLKPKDVKHLPNSVPYPGTVAMTMIKHLRHKTVRWDFHLLSHHLQAGSVLKGAMRLFFHEESISTQTD